MGKKTFFDFIFRVPRKMHLLPGFLRQKIKIGINELRKGRSRAPRSIIFIFVHWLFENSDLISRKSQNFDKNDKDYFQIALKFFFNDQ
jgi:hypothetical protein